MFEITTNKEIKISRGDDSGKFPIVINQGTAIDPDLYEFKEELYVGGKSSSITQILLDKEKFKSKCYKSGLYSFYYLYEQWYLFEDEVELEDYGIFLELDGELQNEDAFSVIYMHEEDDWVRFYVIPLNASGDDWILRKTYWKNGTVISEYDGQVPVKRTNERVIQDGTFLLQINSEDTEWMQPGQYSYQVRMSIKDRSTGKANVSTITNRLPFYVIDDDFDRSWN